MVTAIVLRERLTRFMMAGGILVLGSTLLVTVYEEHQRAGETKEVTTADR
jgi:drug/metabolite transporter (DMT)-like permease